MRTFIIKTIIFFLIIAGLFFCIEKFKKAPTQVSDYMAAIIDKHAHVDLIKKPAIIFGGGSNLAFGIDSKEIEKAFNVPVVNMGLHAGLGLDFILNDLKYSTKKGDLVFLSIEYFLSPEGNYDLKMNTSNYYAPAKNFYHKNYITEFENLLEENRSIFKTIFAEKKNESNTVAPPKPATDLYSRNAFNEKGDVVAHLDLANMESLQKEPSLIYKYWEGIDLLNKFNEYAKSKGVTVFYLFPNYCFSKYQENKAAITLLAKDLKENLKIEILNTPEDLVFSDNDFFDTIYHLNKSGRKKRTDKTIELIKKNANAQAAIAKMQ